MGLVRTLSGGHVTSQKRFTAAKSAISTGVAQRFNRKYGASAAMRLGALAANRRSAPQGGGSAKLRAASFRAINAVDVARAAGRVARGRG